MQKFFVLLLLLVTFYIKGNAQCATLRSAMINSCGVGGGTEGQNEFIVFSTSVAAPASNYVVGYGTTSGGSSSRLSGSDATTKLNPMAGFLSTGGATITEVTSPSTIIPSGATVIFVPNTYTETTTFTSPCSGCTIYVVYINANVGGGNSPWSTGGAIANNAGVGVQRYLSVSNLPSSASCTFAQSTRSYIYNWPSDIDGNRVEWDGSNTNYVNNGCGNIALAQNNLLLQLQNNSLNFSSQISNVVSYEVEASVDGINYEAIKSIMPNYTNQYVFALVNNNFNYYKIKVNTLNQVIYSNTIKIETNANAPIGKIYPSVSNGTINIPLQNNSNVNLIYKILNAQGVEVIKGIKPLQNGNQIIALNTLKLTKGIYFIHLNVASKQSIQKIIVQ